MQDAYENIIDKSKVAQGDNYTSLTGNKVSAQDLKHNNMVPFFGSHVRQRTVNLDSNESMLDNMQGVGSQHICKKGQAPLLRHKKVWGGRMALLTRVIFFNQG